MTTPHETARGGLTQNWLRGLLMMLFLPGGVASSAADPPPWLQWGGPNRDFAVEASGLAATWPENGPRKLWTRPIGGGHSAILSDGDALYTMYRRDEKDVVLALKADTGETLWEIAYDAPMKPNMQLEFGPGPHSTPLLAGDRLYTVSATLLFHCLDKKTGKILWSHDLTEKLKAVFPPRGYGASPIAYRDLVILNCGPEAGMAAFKQDTGEIAWKSQPLKPGFSSPILARINNEDHLIAALGTERVGLDPATGAERWKATVDQQSAATISTPLFIEPDQVFFSAAYGGGSYLFKIVAENGKYKAKELWHDTKMKVHHGTVVRIGDCVYGSSGDFGPAFLMGLELATGKILWRNRDFPKVNLVRAGSKAILLDEEGNLTLATPSPQGLEVHSKVPLLKFQAWTVPTLVGTRLYVRDYHTIMALDLSAAGNKPPS